MFDSCHSCMAHQSTQYSMHSWEPAPNVQGCDRLLDAFWKDIGMDTEDYGVGTICEASPEFIRTSYIQDSSRCHRPSDLLVLQAKKRDSLLGISGKISNPRKNQRLLSRPSVVQVS